MQCIRMFALFSALLIVFLHSFIPHKHHSEFSFTEHEKTHQEASDLLDFLSLAFHVDYGEKHLEEFTSAEAGIQLSDTEFQLPLTIDQCFQLSIAVFDKMHVGFASEPFIANLLLTSKHHLRGPPSLS